MTLPIALRWVVYGMLNMRTSRQRQAWVGTRLTHHPGRSFFGSPHCSHHMLTAGTDTQGCCLMAPFAFHTHLTATHRAAPQPGTTHGMRIRSSMLGEEQQQPKSTSKSTSPALSPCMCPWTNNIPNSLAPLETKRVSTWKTVFVRLNSNTWQRPGQG